MENYKLNFTLDTNSILEALLNDENLLRYLTIQPIDMDDNVTIITPERPSITLTKTYTQRMTDYYLSTTPNILNWYTIPDIATRQTGLVAFYPNVTTFDNNRAVRSQYAFDIYLASSWHKFNNCAYEAARRLVELFQNTHLFGNIGRINGDRLRPIRNVEGFTGYRLNLYQYNFVR